jgi:hypothetical protein
MRMRRLHDLSRGICLAAVLFLSGCATTAGLIKPAPYKTMEGKLGSVSIVWASPQDLQYKVSTVVMTGVASISNEQREFARRRTNDLLTRFRSSIESSLIDALGAPTKRGDDATITISPVQLWVVNGGVTLELSVFLRTADKKHEWVIRPRVNDDAVSKVDKSVEQLNQMILETVVTLIAAEMKKAGWV